MLKFSHYLRQKFCILNAPIRYILWEYFQLFYFTKLKQFPNSCSKSFSEWKSKFYFWSLSHLVRHFQILQFRQNITKHVTRRKMQNFVKINVWKIYRIVSILVRASPVLDLAKEFCFHVLKVNIFHFIVYTCIFSIFFLSFLVFLLYSFVDRFKIRWK